MDKFKRQEVEVERMVKAESLSYYFVDNHIEEIQNENIEQLVERETTDKLPIDVKHIVIDCLEHVKEKLDD